MLKQPFNNSRNENASRTDADLISDIADGDEAAFTVLMTRHKAPLFRFILRYVGTRADAEDLLQDTFFSVYAKAAHYDPAWKPSTWIYRIALNKCRDFGRRQRFRRMFTLSSGPAESESPGFTVPEPADENPSVESLVAHREELRHLTVALQKLPHKMRSALVLHTIEGRSQSECAEILGVSRKSVEMLVYRARKTLRQDLGYET